MEKIIKVKAAFKSRASNVVYSEGEFYFSQQSYGLEPLFYREDFGGEELIFDFDTLDLNSPILKAFIELQEYYSHKNRIEENTILTHIIVRNVSLEERLVLDRHKKTTVVSDSNSKNLAFKVFLYDHDVVYDNEIIVSKQPIEVFRGNFIFSYIRGKPFPYFPKEFKYTFIAYSSEEQSDKKTVYSNPELLDFIFSFEELQKEHQKIKLRKKTLLEIIKKLETKSEKEQKRVLEAYKSLEENLSLYPYETFTHLTHHLNSKYRNGLENIPEQFSLPFIPILGKLNHKPYIKVKRI